MQKTNIFAVNYLLFLHRAPTYASKSTCIFDLFTFLFSSENAGSSKLHARKLRKYPSSQVKLSFLYPITTRECCQSTIYQRCKSIQEAQTRMYTLPTLNQKYLYSITRKHIPSSFCSLQSLVNDNSLFS